MMTNGWPHGSDKASATIPDVKKPLSENKAPGEQGAKQDESDSKKDPK